MLTTPFLKAGHHLCFAFRGSVLGEYPVKKRKCARRCKAALLLNGRMEKPKPRFFFGANFGGFSIHPESKGVSNWHVWTDRKISKSTLRITDHLFVDPPMEGWMNLYDTGFGSSKERIVLRGFRILREWLKSGSEGKNWFPKIEKLYQHGFPVVCILASLFFLESIYPAPWNFGLNQSDGRHPIQMGYPLVGSTNFRWLGWYYQNRTWNFCVENMDHGFWVWNIELHKDSSFNFVMFTATGQKSLGEILRLPTTTIRLMSSSQNCGPRRQGRWSDEKLFAVQQGKPSKKNDEFLEPDGHLFINGCFNWMIPNLYIGNGCFTKHPFKTDCLGYQVVAFLGHIISFKPTLPSS